MSKLPIAAIIGRPNVGKSSLFNRLVGRRFAIVYDQPGTTRDSVQNMVEHQGRSAWLLDTAGIDQAEGELEQNVQEQVAQAQSVADVIVLVVDGAQPISAQEQQIAKKALQSRKPVVLAVNKVDKAHNRVEAHYQKLGIKQIIGTSAVHATGAEELITAIFEALPRRSARPEKAEHTIALLGRPNVGKSSVFNALTSSQKAVVSATPNTTRDVNRHTVTFHGQKVQLLDTAGLRRKSKAMGMERISWLRTIGGIAEADVGVLLIDATEPSVAVDQKIAGMVREAGKGLIIAINKWDQVKSEEDAQKRLEARLAHDFAFTWWAPLVLTSATTKHNLPKLIELSLKIIELRKQQIPTSELNKVVQAAMAAHPPAGVDRRHPKLKYVTQTGIGPPEFTLFGRHLGYLHWSYRRYLEKQLREAFDFTGTPIKLIVKDDEVNSRPRQPR